MRQLLLFFLFWATVASFNTISANGLPSESGPSDAECKLGPPDSLRVTSVGTTWGVVRWRPLLGAVAYRVRVVAVASGTVVQNFVTPATQAAIGGLQPATQYRVYVAGICPNGQEGKPAMVSLDTIILDIVVNYHDKVPPHLLPIATHNDCVEGAWNNYECWLQVWESGSFLGMFHIGMADGSISVNQVLPADGSNYLFNEDSQGPPQQDNESVLIMNGDLPILAVYFSGLFQGNGDLLQICVDGLSDKGFAYQFLEATALRPHPVLTTRRGSLPSDITTSLVAAPNPMRAGVQVQYTGNGAADLAILDCHGRTYWRQTVEGAGAWPVSSEPWPSGCYYLVARSEEDVKVLKLLKL